MKIKICVVGYGHLGKWHCDKAAQMPGATLSYIVETHPQNKSAAQAAHPSAQVVSTVEETFGKTDAYILVLPTSMHTPFIKKLIPQQVPIFCEKPLSESYHETLEIQSLMEQYHYKSVFQVGHSERFHEAWDKLRALPQFAPIINGDWNMTVSRVAAFKGRATDVDVISDLMIHDMDILYVLLGKIPQKVFARGYKTVSAKWDYVICDCFYSEGKSATVVASRMDVEEVRKCVISSALGHISVDLLHLEMKTFLKRDNEESFVSHSEKLEKRDHLFQEQLAFVNAITQGTKNPVPFGEAQLMMKVLTAIRESLETHEEVYLV